MKENLNGILQKKVFVLLKIDIKKGRKAYFSNPEQYYVTTPLLRLLAKAYAMEKLRQQNLRYSFNEFCEKNNISPRYLKSILQFNNLSPKLKHSSVQQILPGKPPVLWNEQEEMFKGSN